MSILTNAVPATEPETQTRPAVQPITIETLPANPNDPFGVRREIIEEIEKIGRRYNEPRK